MKITWKCYGLFHGATVCHEGEVGETLAELLSPVATGIPSGPTETRSLSARRNSNERSGTGE